MITGGDCMRCGGPHLETDCPRASTNHPYRPLIAFGAPGCKCRKVETQHGTADVVDWRCPVHRDGYSLDNDQTLKLVANLRDTVQTLDVLLKTMAPRGLRATAAQLIEEHLGYADELIGKLRRKIDSLEERCKHCDGRGFFSASERLDMRSSRCPACRGRGTVE